MTPHTIVGWILFASMWLSGPIYGYAASDLIATIWDDRPIKRRELLIAGISGGITLVLVLVLTFVDGL